jgi:MSHA biogenesis protein MshO
MTDRALPRQRGFTLIEAIIAMVITGIVAGIVAVFMTLPITGYVDAVRRAEMTDIADLALRRMAYDLRAAVPNTVRVNGTSFLEFVPASDGGRYRSQLAAGGGGDILDGTSAADTTFDVLGPVVSEAAGGSVVIFNTGQVGLDIYAGLNRRLLSAAAASTVSFTAVPGNPFPPYESPSQRFQLVAATGPVTFACTAGISAAGDGAGELRRYTGYGFTATQPTTFSTGTNALLADKLSACHFEYAPISAANGLVMLNLTVTQNSESITLHQEIHVDNTP